MNVFFSTDGFADQRGGNAGKKFSTKRMEEMFAETAFMNGSEKEKFIKKKFNDWAGTYQQLDDVLVMGIKI